MQAEAKVSSKGRVTIPRVVRRALHLNTGDTVVFDVDDGGVRLRRRHDKTVQDFTGAARSGTGKTVAEIVDEIRSLRGSV